MSEADEPAASRASAKRAQRAEGVRRAVLLVDHGSRRPEASAQLDTLARRVAERLPGWIVETAHLELVPPSLAEGLAACVAAGARDVVIHPFLLAPGRHVLEDLPRLAAEAAARHPGVVVRVSEALGLHEKLVDVVLERIGACG